jgi:F-type H+-transporting ATPase subunit b
VNWIYGVLGESDEVDEPSLLWRKTGMPVPLAAQLFNSLILFYVLYRYGKKAVVDGLASRREGIMRGIEAASKMKAEAREQLASYEAKLQKVDSEIERVRREMREAAEAEQNQILEEAKKRRERMERDAKLLISQELKAAREQLLQETIGSAMASAEQLVREKVGSADHQRLSDEYLAALQGSIKSGSIVRAQRTGGAA